MRYLLKIRDKNLEFRTVNADFTNLSVKNSFVKEQARIELGEVTIIGDDFDLIQEITTRLTSFILYENGEILGTGNIDLFTKKDLDNKKLVLKLNNLDVYSPFDLNGDTEYNINEVEPVKNVYYSYSQEYEEFTTVFTDLDIPTFHNGVYYEFDQPFFFNQIEVSNYYIKKANPSFAFLTLVTCSDPNYSNNPLLRTTLTVDYYRIISEGSYNGSTAVEPNIPGTWVYFEDRVKNGVTFPYFYKKLADENYHWSPHNYGPCSGDPVLAFVNYVYQNVEDAVSTQIDYSNVFRRLTDVIKFLVEKIDNTILFDSTGMIKDSFYSFKMFEGDNLRRWAISDGVLAHYQLGPKLFENLMVCNLTDFTPTNAGLQKDHPANLTNLSFNRLLNYWKENGFLWFLEKRPTGNYFRLIHYLHIDSFNSSLVFPRKYTFKTRNITPILPTYNRIINDKRVSGLDFISEPVVFKNVLETAEISLTDNNVFTDINNIFISKDDFSDTENNNIIIVSTGEGHISTGSNYIVRDATGLVSGLRKNNSELSFSYLAEKYFSQLPDKNANINGNDIVINVKRLAKTQKISLTLPIINIEKTYPINFKVKFLNEMVNIDNISRSGHNNFCKMEIIK